jgi:hypothetical protein
LHRVQNVKMVILCLSKLCTFLLKKRKKISSFLFLWLDVVMEVVRTLFIAVTDTVSHHM